MQEATRDRLSVLFTGYAPVHFVCFRPLYERLTRDARVDVFVSGGLRAKSEDGVSYDLGAMYDPFGIPDSHRLEVEELSERDFDFLFAANTKMIMPRSVGRRVQIFHGVSFRNKAVREDNAGADNYFIVGPYMKRAFAESGVVPADDPRAIDIGFMKTDVLLDGSLSRADALGQLGLSGDRPVLLYAPTGQKHNSLETMGEEVISRLSESGEFDLVVKPHDHPKNPIDWRSRLSALAGPRVVVTDEKDVCKLMCAADMLITDASSVSNEFALLDRPIVFLDVPKLIAKAQQAENAMVDLDTWGRRGGEVVERPEDVVRTVARSLEGDPRHAEVRREMARDLFYNPGCATGAALEWLEAALPSERAPVA